MPRRMLTYARCKLWLHATAWMASLIPFIMLLQIPFRPPASSPLFEIASGRKTVIISASGFCTREDARSATVCAWRKFQDFDRNAVPWADSVIAQDAKTINSFRVAAVALLVGFILHTLLHCALFARHRSAFRQLHPHWKALTTLASTFLLVAFAVWVALSACVLEAYVHYCRRDVSEATIDGQSISLENGPAQAVLHASTAISLLGVLASLILLACWDFRPERDEVLRRLKGKELESTTDGKEVNMRDAIAIARDGFEHSAHPPVHPPHRHHPEDTEDDPFAPDGRIKQVYKAPDGHTERAWIAADLSSSPTNNSAMPAPEELTPEQHPYTEPIWRNKAASTRPAFAVMQKAPAFASTPVAPKRQRSTGPPMRRMTSDKALPAPPARQPSLAERRKVEAPANLGGKREEASVMERPRPLPKKVPNPARPDSLYAQPPPSPTSKLPSPFIVKEETPSTGLPYSMPSPLNVTAPLRLGNHVIAAR